MGISDDNLFARMYGFATRQNENYCTEALAYVLRILCDSAPDRAEKILAQMANKDSLPINTSKLEIKTQDPLSNNMRPDITIKGENCLIYIEVKVEDSQSKDQLKSYKGELDSSNKKCKHLIYLTKYFEEVADKSVSSIRWYEVANWLGELKSIQGESGYIVKRFLDFLKWRNMTLEKVADHLTPGIESLNNLILMLEKSLRDLDNENTNYKHSRSSGSKYNGFNFCKNTNEYKFFVGIHVEYPNELAFNIDDPELRAAFKKNQRVSDQQFRKVGGRYRTSFEFSESFFKKNADEQIEDIRSFIKKSYEDVMRICLSTDK